MDVKEEDILGADIATHWYYVAKGRALRAFLRGVRAGALLDVGAGSGVFSRQLLDAGMCERATCVDPAYAREHDEIHNGRQITFLRAVERPAADLVLMMDVLEHVDDDRALLRQYTDAMPQGGRVLITVPAFRFLWSGHDVFLEHRRRYTRAGIEAAVRDAGLAVERCRYFYGLLFPAAAAVRLYRAWQLRHHEIEAKSDLRPAPAPLNRALTLIHDLERVTLFRFNIFAGLSVFCLARKL
ncbi:MAG: class I SAM-dependent methyltransferase [Alphaproteobacteria bacterium]|nr:class I SAM-dependent methyltransferase [Alphaproteobacteria bacterium]